MRSVIDLEGNGLLDTLNTLWCAVAYDIDRQKFDHFVLKDGNYDEFLEYLSRVEVFIGHNIIGYDLDATSMICQQIYDKKICDTLVLSRLANPDRKLPFGCPTHTPDPVSGKKLPVGPHGLESWGYRVANHKPYIDRWTEWHPKILTRCDTDVRINYLTLVELMKEMELSELPTVDYMFAHKWSKPNVTA